jgi:hypothetical protein
MFALALACIAGLAQANKAVASSEPLLDLPMNLVKGQTFPNFQFFGGDVEESVMQYSLLQNLTPLPVAIKMIAQQVRNALGPDSEAHGQPKEFLFFVNAAVVTQNDQDDRQAPYWSNTVPNRKTALTPRVRVRRPRPSTRHV